MSRETIGPFPSPLPNAGEADTIREIDHHLEPQDKLCGAWDGRYVCTRKFMHHGDHLAGDGRKIVARWPQSNIEQAASFRQELVDDMEPQEPAVMEHHAGSIAEEVALLMPVRPNEHRLERRRFYLAAELCVHGWGLDYDNQTGQPVRRALSSEESLRYADDLILEHLGTLDKFLDRVRESAKETADA